MLRTTTFTIHLNHKIFNLSMYQWKNVAKNLQLFDGIQCVIHSKHIRCVCVCVCTVCIRLRRIWWCLMVVLLANCMHFTSKWQSTAESIVCHWKHILAWDNLFFKYSIVIHYNFIKSEKFYKSFESVLNYVLCVGHKLLPLNAPVSCCFRYIQPMDLLHAYMCVFFFSCSHFIFIV